MKQLKVAVSANLDGVFESVREQVPVQGADWTEVSAVVLSTADLQAGKLEEVEALHLGIPVFAVADGTMELPVGRLHAVIDTNPTNKAFYGRQVDNAAQKYEEKLLPPFFGSLEQYVQAGNLQFDCPGHQGGAFFRRHPAGRAFYDFFGENVFRADLCNADVSMGDLLIHEGAPCAAQKAAAKIYNAV